MCPSCIPALPMLAGALSGGGFILGLRRLLAGSWAKAKTPERLSFPLKEKNS